jgi:hypothetical protein
MKTLLENGHSVDQSTLSIIQNNSSDTINLANEEIKDETAYFYLYYEVHRTLCQPYLNNRKMQMATKHTALSV